MTRPALGDAVVRARGLQQHLLDGAQLRRLARAAGSGALVAALADLGYWIAPAAGGVALPPARIAERAIEHESIQRLAVLVHWLAERRSCFAPLFELEVRDTLRLRIDELAEGAGPDEASVAATPSGWPELRDLRRALARAGDLRGLVRVLARRESPYAAPLAAAQRHAGEADVQALEAALDATWAWRAHAAAARVGPAMRVWIEDELDLQNAWTALAAASGPFVAGGRALSRPAFDAIAGERDGAERRRRLAKAFRTTGLGAVFDDPDVGWAALETRAKVARIAKARAAARLDPIGDAPILELVLRLRCERADLRCIAWGVAAGMPVETIVSMLSARGGPSLERAGGRAA